jgi:hypothetical protein
MNDSPIATTKEEKVDTAEFRFSDPNEVYQTLGSDFNLNDTVELLVKGTVTRFSTNNGDYKESCLSLNIVSINGKTGKTKDNEKEMKDMTDDNKEDEDQGEYEDKKKKSAK